MIFALLIDSISAMPADYWQTHGLVLGVLILLGIVCVPRITLYFLLPSFGFFNPFHWLGYVTAPRLLALVLGMQMYWHTNPILLCVAVIMWLIVSYIKLRLMPWAIGALFSLGVVSAALGMVGLGSLIEWFDDRKGIRARNRERLRSKT